MKKGDSSWNWGNYLNVRSTYKILSNLYGYVKRKFGRKAFLAQSVLSVLKIYV